MDKRIAGFAWVILILAVVIYVLFLTPGDHTPPPPSPCNFPPPFVCSTSKLHTETSELDVVIGQGTGYSIEITGLVCTQNTSKEFNNSNINNYAENPIVMFSGSYANISKAGTTHVIRCTDANGKQIQNTSIGSLYGGKIYVNYTELDTNRTIIVIGSLNAKYES